MNYKKQLVKFKTERMTELSLLIFAVSFVASTAVNLFGFKRPLLITGKVYWDIAVVIAIYAAGLFLHEGLHALCAIICGKKSRDISFGMNLKQMMLFCHVKTPMKNSEYRFLLLTPAVITGIIPLIISMCCGNIFLTLVFSLLSAGGAGDFIMFASLLKHDKNGLIEDHAEAPAYYLVFPEDELPEDFTEATEEDEAALKAEMSAKKSSRSNTVRIFAILIFLVFAVAAIFILALFMKLF